MGKQKHKKSGIPRLDISKRFIKFDKVSGAKVIKMKIGSDTPPLLVEPSKWQLKTQGKTSFDVELTIDDQYQDIYLNWFLFSSEIPFEKTRLLFPNVKEITESAAMYKRVSKYMKSSSNVIVIADGATPRTGYLFAVLRSAHHVFSIDPLMKDEWVDYAFKEALTVCKSSIEDWFDVNFTALSKDQQIIVVCPHSHVLLSVIASRLVGFEVVIIALPCCFDQSLSVEEQSLLGITLQEDDFDLNVHTEKNNVKIWAK